MNVRRLTQALFSIITLAAYCTLAEADQQQKSRLDEVLARGYLIVGVASDSPPFGFVDPKGELIGFDIDIARLIAKGIFADEKKVEFVKQSFAARWANVQSGKVDFGIQLTTIIPDRTLRVAFTRTYMDSGMALLVNKNSPIRKVADLNNEKYTLANLPVPSQIERTQKLFPKAKSATFDSVSTQFTALKTGRADAAQFDVPVALWYAKENPTVRVLDEWITPSQNNAIFLKIGDFAWWHVLDTLVGEMRGGSRWDEYKTIYNKWFGIDPPHAKWYVKEGEK